MRCQAQFNFTNETRFRSGGERNVEQQKMNTTLCHNGQTQFPMEPEFQYIL